MDKDSQVEGNLATTHAKAIMEDIVSLALQVNQLPPSPSTVQKAQDNYFDALMNLYAAAEAVKWNDTWANVDAYNNAWAGEFKHLQVWLRELDRATLH